MGLIVHLVLGGVYSVGFIVGYRSLKAGEADRAAKYGIVGVVALVADVALYRIGVGLFS